MATTPTYQNTNLDTYIQLATNNKFVVLSDDTVTALFPSAAAADAAATTSTIPGAAIKTDLAKQSALAADLTITDSSISDLKLFEDTGVFKTIKNKQYEDGSVITRVIVLYIRIKYLSTLITPNRNEVMQKLALNIYLLLANLDEYTKAATAGGGSKKKKGGSQKITPACGAPAMGGKLKKKKKGGNQENPAANQPPAAPAAQPPAAPAVNQPPAAPAQGAPVAPAQPPVAPAVTPAQPPVAPAVTPAQPPAAPAPVAPAVTQQPPTPPLAAAAQVVPAVVNQQPPTPPPAQVAPPVAQQPPTPPPAPAAQGGKKRSGKGKQRGGMDTAKIYNAQGLIQELSDLNRADSLSVALAFPSPFSASGSANQGSVLEALPATTVQQLLPSISGGKKKVKSAKKNKSSTK